VAAVGPAQLLQPLQERCDARCRLWIVRGQEHEHAEAPRPLALLRARCERPRRRAAEQRDEIASFHWPVPPVLRTKDSTALLGCGISTLPVSELGSKACCSIQRLFRSF